MQVNDIEQCRQPVAADPEPKNSNRTRRKSRWKLKFHHQALPPEYLDHYEASLQQQNIKAEPVSQMRCNSCSDMVSSTVSSSPSGVLPTDGNQPLSSTVRYKDLPYMGEMTLDNARPRRGRKPKKADICHLIYKNYGTMVVEEPLNLCLRDLQNNDSSNEVSMCKFKFTAGAIPSLEERRSVSLDSTGNLTLIGKNKVLNKEISKRRSRKSVAREKLEKTFKERGFLIQTQQLESAQGATYCKFRQLRKFTRYLFRSWKHHLPGDVVNTTNLT